jgi:hypothetical protein
MHRTSSSASATVITAVGGLIIRLQRKLVQRVSAPAFVCLKQRVEPTAMLQTVHSGSYVTCPNWRDLEDAYRECDCAQRRNTTTIVACRSSGVGHRSLMPALFQIPISI